MQPARLSIEAREGRVVLMFAGRLDAAEIGPLWRPAIRAAQQARDRGLAFDLSGVSFCDVSGAAFLAEAEAAHGAAAELLGAAGTGGVRFCSGPVPHARAARRRRPARR